MSPSTPIVTYFLPIERADAVEVRADVERLRSHGLLDAFAAAVPELFLVLNPQRQIVFANRALLELLGVASVDEVAGLRVGEALDCIHSDEPPHGCGTTEFCCTCGAAQAMFAGQRGREDEQECRITRQDGSALDLRVRARPLELDGRRYLLFSVTDISHEKRRRALERIFFHDILNTAGGLLGVAELLHGGSPAEVADFKDTILPLAGALVDDIRAQQTLMAAERGELAPTFGRINSWSLLCEVYNTYANHEVSMGRRLAFDPAAQPVIFTSDAALVRRVLGNMVKNALEACRPGQTATLGCRSVDAGIEFTVHNPGFIERTVQLQIFQRSFSSKGPGRGLGAYSMKLLSEHFLQGAVGFTTDREAGTTFWVRFPLQPDLAALESQ